MTPQWDASNYSDEQIADMFITIMQKSKIDRNDDEFLRWFNYEHNDRFKSIQAIIQVKWGK